MQGLMHLSWSSGLLSQRTCTPGVPFSLQALQSLRLALPATWQASSLVTHHPALTQPRFTLLSCLNTATSRSHDSFAPIKLTSVLALKWQKYNN